MKTKIIVFLIISTALVVGQINWNTSPIQSTEPEDYFMLLNKNMDSTSRETVQGVVLDKISDSIGVAKTELRAERKEDIKDTLGQSLVVIPQSMKVKGVLYGGNGAYWEDSHADTSYFVNANFNFWSNLLVRGALKLRNGLTFTTFGDSTTVSGTNLLTFRTPFNPNPWVSGFVGANYANRFTNTIMGTGAGATGIIGANNVVLGGASATSISTGNNNLIAGYSAATGLTSGTFNTILGAETSQGTLTGSYNFFSGRSAGRLNTSGSYNLNIGLTAGRNNLTGENNIMLGNAAGFNNLSNNNIFIGQNSGYNNTVGKYSIILGGWQGKIRNDSLFIASAGGDSTKTPFLRANMTAGKRARKLTIDGLVSIAGRDSTASPVEGEIFYDGVLHVLKCWNGSEWKRLW